MSLNSVTPLISSSSGISTQLSEIKEQLKQVSETPVPDLPSYFEKYTSFETCHIPRQIFEQITEALELLSAEFKLLGSRHQIQGSFCEKYNSTKFKVNLFKNKDRYLVELQRVSGDSMTFNILYQKLMKKLLAVPNSVCRPLNPTIESKYALNSSDKEFGLPPANNVTLDQFSLQPLKLMAESKYVDVAREGMKTLAQCSISPQNHRLLANQCLDLFYSLLSSQDEDLARYAAFIVGQLSHN
jgi:hypothetical protein